MLITYLNKIKLENISFQNPENTEETIFWHPKNDQELKIRQKLIKYLGVQNQ